MIALYIITILFILLMVGICFVAVRMYAKALALNPQNRTLDQLLKEIETSQLTIEHLKENIQNLQAEKLSAEETIAKKKDAEEFLNTHEAEIQQKRQFMQQINDELRQLTDKQNKKEDEYRQLCEECTALGKQVAETTIELTSLSAQIEAEEKAENDLKENIRSLEERKARLEEELNALLSEIEHLKNSLAELERKKKELEAVQHNISQGYEELSDLKKQISAAKIEESEYQGRDVVSEHRWEDLDRPYIVVEKKEAKALNENTWLDQFKQNLKGNNIDFDDRTINAFHTGLKVASSSPLVVLAGISGTGKSLLPQLYAHAIGMNFLSVAVQPRWDSPQDMFGFYNYMQNKFKATELSRLLWQYDYYNNERAKTSFASSGQLPMNLVLLDEMNLARVEYYFSDMLSKLEVRRTVSEADEEKRPAAEIELECGSIAKKELSRRLFVGKNTLFVGTMNEDETTQSLSDKVMDRSNVLRFGRPKKLQSNPKINDFYTKYNADTYLSFETWEMMDGKRGITSAQQDQLSFIINGINKCLSDVGRPFAHRVWQSIENYVAAYPNIGTSNHFSSAISDQIEMKVLPKLNGLDKNSPGVIEALNKVEGILEEKVKDETLTKAFRAVKNDSSSIFFTWKGVER